MREGSGVVVEGGGEGRGKVKYVYLISREGEERSG